MSFPFAVKIGRETVRICPIFKGGTSLSKAYGLIQRFSEDVDLLVPVPFDEPGGYSQNQRTEVMRCCTGAVSAALGIEGAPKSARKGVDRHWLYPYRPMATADPLLAGVEPAIRVEVTVMGGKSPHSVRPVTSMVAEHAVTIAGFPAYDDLTPVEVDTLAAERTLVEKLAMLHDAAHRALAGQPRRLEGSGRHYYDVALLLSDDAVRSALDSSWVSDIAADADRWSDRGNFPFTERPADGFGASPAFNDPELLHVVRRSYDLAMEWVWGGSRPSLAECAAIVRESSTLL